MVPSFFAKLFAGATDWSFTLSEDGSVAHIVSDGVEHAADIMTLTVSTGMFWGRVTGDGFVLDGVPKNACASLAENIRHRKIQLFGDSLCAWHDEAIRIIENAFADHGWISAEEKNRIIASRPAAVTGKEAPQPDASGQVLAACTFWQRDIPSYVAERNSRFANDRIVKDAAFFKTAEKSPLTKEQARAVLCFDNRTLLVASAGSGKTSVIVAKAAYAIHRGYFKPDEILIMAFNRKAAEELQDRIQARLKYLGHEGPLPAVSTFHAFALSVIGQATGKKPSVPSWAEYDSGRSSMLQSIVSALCASDPAIKSAWQFFAGFLFHEQQDGKGDDYDDDAYRTVKCERVRSKAEKMLADWFAYMGVAYAYEKAYPISTADAKHRQYKPDFYLPDADLYVELWALADGEREPAGFEGYQAGKQWKRDLHKRNGTELAEVTAREVWSGAAFRKLEHILLAKKLTLKPGSDVSSFRQDVGETQTSKLVLTFLSHVKNARLTPDVLEQRSIHQDSGLRGKVFLSLFWKIYEKWQDKLQEEHGIDFDDMVGKAADIIKAGKWESPYRLVMADEFQDTSISRAELLTSLTAATDRYMFVVGDDWQGINRFAGSDLSVMTKFERRFGEATSLKLETTFRFPQTMCDVMGGFILQNTEQIRKTVRSAAASVESPIRLLAVPPRTMGDAVQKVLAEIATAGPASVLILGRYNRDRAVVPRFAPDGLSVEFLTIHTAKGREADYVLIVNADDGKFGIPSKIEDDPLLALVTPDADPFPYAEERRIFYVAVTRARRQTYILSSAGKISQFVKELARDYDIPIVQSDADGEDEEIRLCPKCGMGEMILKTGKFGAFLGCSRYPRCRYTENVDDGS